ncbi:hypothetical protein GOBAR_DD15073 [Gossypium barbadense]|nr:hypothetical protein GOBAR_DD15073 [Gossypium barbadense]
MDRPFNMFNSNNIKAIIHPTSGPPFQTVPPCLFIDRTHDTGNLILLKCLGELWEIVDTGQQQQQMLLEISARQSRWTDTKTMSVVNRTLMKGGAISRVCGMTLF